MGTRSSLLFGGLLMVCVSAASVEADINVGLSLDQDGLKEHMHIAGPGLILRRKGFWG